MIESYALMVLVMGTFFVYFCGMVWAFCNPKLSGAEQECGSGDHAGGCWVCARAACAHHPPAAPRAAPGPAQTTYVNFWDDTDSLLSDGTAFCRDEHGINNQIGNSPSWSA